MKPSFHEDFSRKEEVKGSSDRGFGLTVGGILLAIAARPGRAAAVGRRRSGVGRGRPRRGRRAALGVRPASAPARLAPLNRAWTRLGLLLFKVVNPVVLGLIYLTTIVPIGLLMRLRGRDLLSLKFDRQAASYWVVRSRPGRRRRR